MRNVTAATIPAVDIWPHVDRLNVKSLCLPGRSDVHCIYRDARDLFDQISTDTGRSVHFYLWRSIVNNVQSLDTYSIWTIRSKYGVSHRKTSADDTGFVKRFGRTVLAASE